MDVIIETDIGRDADDFFALCYLAQAPNVAIRAVTITPGDADQVAVARFLLDEFGLRHVPIGIPISNRNKFSVTPFHTEILKQFKYPTQDHRGIAGEEVIDQTVKLYPDSELFCIGPVTNVAKWIVKTEMDYIKTGKPTVSIKRATMQGGFCSYNIHRPPQALAKFEGMETCPTFNLNGDVEGGKTFIATPVIKERNFIGKNVCHAIVMNQEKHDVICKRWCGPGPFESATEGYWKVHNLPKPIQIFLHGCYNYFQKHPEKKFHDPSAAVCMIHPEIATWVKGKTYRGKGGWGTNLVGSNVSADNICVEIDHNKLWKHIINMD